MNQPCQLNDVALLDYIRGQANDDIRLAIEQSPACLQAVEELRRAIEPLFVSLERAICPDSNILVAYQEGELSGEESKQIQFHIEYCSFCQEEMGMLAEVDRTLEIPPELVPSESMPSLISELGERIRSTVEALFVSPLELGLAGDNLLYETAELVVSLTVQKRSGAMNGWRLDGELETGDGQPFTKAEEIYVQDIEYPELSAVHATWLENSSFAFELLEDGRYHMYIVTPDSMVTISNIKLGDGR